MTLEFDFDLAECCRKNKVPPEFSAWCLRMGATSFIKVGLTCPSEADVQTAIIDQLGLKDPGSDATKQAVIAIRTVWWTARSVMQGNSPSQPTRKADQFWR